jgi:SAM-dependent methyltransferase
MPLVDLNLAVAPAAIPPDVRRFIREADRRIDEFQARGRVTGFVASDYEGVYHVLRALAESPLARGNRFCEWGSGFGAVACLAAMLGFDASGIEVEGELVGEARRLAEDFELPVEFAHGSFVPRGAEGRVYAGGEYAWLTTEADYAYEELGLDPDDFDVVFCYPWPDEEGVTAELFDRYAGDGAILVTFHGGDDFRLRRKTARRARRRG